MQFDSQKFMEELEKVRTVCHQAGLREGVEPTVEQLAEVCKELGLIDQTRLQEIIGSISFVKKESNNV